MYLSRSPIITFTEQAEASPEGSKDEVLFSGLAKLAYDMRDIQRSLDDLKREVSSIS